MDIKIVREADLPVLGIGLCELVVTTDGKLMVDDGSGFRDLLPAMPVFDVASGTSGGTKFMRIGSILHQSKTLLIPAGTTTMNVTFDMPFVAGSSPIVVASAMDGEPISFYTSDPTATGFKVIVTELVGAGIVNYSADGIV